MFRQKPQQSYLYQISQFPVKKNLWIMNGHLFLIRLCRFGQVTYHQIPSWLFFIKLVCTCYLW